jgi:hypothetical protein
MPFTPYHFGINALPGLVSRGRLDIFVLTAANVLIDTEVLADSYFAPGWPVHQFWHFHTLLVGGLAGAFLGALIYGIKPFRRISQGFNSLVGFASSPTLISMILSGIIGAWLHVLVDGLYHYDVEAFWPIHGNLLLQWAGNIHWLRTYIIGRSIIRICILGWLSAVILSVFFLCHRLISSKKTISSDLADSN